MKSTTTIAASICISFAAALFASSASAQSGTPNSAPPRPAKIATVPPPPPPPGGPDKLTTKTLPDINRPSGPARPPKPIDEFAAARPNPRAAMDRRCQNNSWCHSMYVQSCDDEGGGMRTNEDGSEECVMP